MPIYEYRCLTCEARFEALVFGDEKTACPECRGEKLERLMSACGFKSGGGDGASSSGSSSCSGCTSTSCSGCH